MSALGWFIGVAGTLAFAVVSELISAEARARLDRVPGALLKVAVGRLPVELRADVGDEWEAELCHILRGDEAFPVTRLVHGIGYALGLLRTAPQIGRELTEVREFASADAVRAGIKDPRDARTGFIVLLQDVNGRLPLAEFIAALLTAVSLTAYDDWQTAVAPVLLICCLSACYRRCKALISGIIPPERRASAARRRTRRRLVRLTWAGHICLHGRTIPGTDDIIDHLLIGPTGVHVLSSQWLDRRLPVRMSKGEPLYHGPQSRNDLLRDIWRQAAQVAALLGSSPDAPGEARPGLIIYGPRVWTAAPLHDVDVLSPRKLHKWLRRGPRSLSALQVRQLTDIAVNALPPATEIRKREPLPAR